MFKKLLRSAIFSWLKLDTHNTSQSYFCQRSFIHEVGATVEYSLDALPGMDETSHILNLLAQGLCLDSWTRNRAMLVTVLIGRPWKQLSGYAPESDSNFLVFTSLFVTWVTMFCTRSEDVTFAFEGIRRNARKEDLKNYVINNPKLCKYAIRTPSIWHTRRNHAS